ncbi:hypothetical protein RJT34_18540 [Clitoria ternatea]|uniref:Uncharacterized protein n=1 Tax=Clitoria ternatea TaxID=43366 RepID=A0AAN9JE61_CLITE
MSIDEGISFGLYNGFKGPFYAGCKTVMFIHYIIYFVGRNQLDSCLVGNAIFVRSRTPSLGTPPRRSRRIRT